MQLGGVQSSGKAIIGKLYCDEPLPPPRVVDKGEFDQGGEHEGGAGAHPDINCLMVMPVIICWELNQHTNMFHYSKHLSPSHYFVCIIDD